MKNFFKPSKIKIGIMLFILVSGFIFDFIFHIFDPQAVLLDFHNLVTVPLFILPLSLLFIAVHFMPLQLYPVLFSTAPVQEVCDKATNFFCEGKSQSIGLIDNPLLAMIITAIVTLAYWYALSCFIVLIFARRRK